MASKNPPLICPKYHAFTTDINDVVVSAQILEVDSLLSSASYVIVTDLEICFLPHEFRHKVSFIVQLKLLVITFWRLGILIRNTFLILI